ncbi:hypothetical protein RclHR1_04300005 [Rhizophagus clarus]|uniref:MACPF domain-containing protein n=1 Tax=Rhizophagus clarus TaxID=94130 RepID=A0A2Z6RL22_9GLOM|nr:hypothetical protein RclHR1_04300005 [Rhizophagus clarus]GES72702.1 hypothetical protein GLOIN_2v1473659 [Rhizophagus clarus]
MTFEMVVINIVEESSESCTLRRLNLEDSLSDIRKNDKNINNSLLFSKKLNNDIRDNNEINEVTKLSEKYAKIESEDEKNYHLREIITVINEQNYLFLMKRPCWNIFNSNCKLDYGCTMSFDGIKKANKRAFKMKDCELTEIKAKGYKKDKLEFESKEDWMRKTNLFFSNDVNIQNFAELGLSIGNSQDEKFNDEIKSVYEYIELGKMKLKFHLEPSEEFIKEINSAIECDDLEEYRKITEEYGQFIPTEVILGGRVYFNNIKMSSKNSVDKSNESSTSMKIGPLNFKLKSKANKSEGKSKFYCFNKMRLLGGNHPEGENFDEKNWIESLRDDQTWEVIEYKNAISIFQLVPDTLCKIPYKSIGKRILYTYTEDCDYYISKSHRHRDFELKLPRNILNVIQNKEADCDIFATVIDTEDSKNIFFNCQILKPKSENGELVKPRILIHGIQKKFKSHKFKLKIKIMIVGYDKDFNFILPTIEVIKKHHNSRDHHSFDSIALSKQDLMTRNIPFFGIPVFEDLNHKSLVIGHNFRNVDNELKIDVFSYCSKNSRYVDLPEFTFCTLIINDPISNAYGLLPFKFSMLKKKPFIDLKKEFASYLNPKYVSLCLSKDTNNYKPFFLKQKIEQIKIKYVNCNCSKTGKICSICQRKTLGISKSENDVECIIYDQL